MSQSVMTRTKTEKVFKGNKQVEKMYEKFIDSKNVMNPQSQTS